MNFNMSLWDLTRSVCLIAVIVMMLLYVPKFVDGFSSSGKKLDETEITRIAANVVKAQLAENDRELTTLIKELIESNNESIKAAKEAGETITGAGVATATTDVTTRSANSDITIADGDVKRALDDTIVYQEDADGNDMPVARVFYSPNIDGDERWGTQTFPIEYNVSIIETEDRDGIESRYVEFWAENDFVLSSKGKKYPLDLKEVKWAKKEKKDKEFMYNLRVGLTGVYTNLDNYMGIDISPFSYGRTKKDMDWRFLTINAGMDDDRMLIGLTPVSYNVGNVLPIIENIFVGPNISINDESETMYGISLSIPF
jgi:hypothetical protein